MLLLASRGTKRFFASTANSDHNNHESASKKLSAAQRAAYDYYRRQREDTMWFRLFGSRNKNNKRNRASNNNSAPQFQYSLHQRNVNTAWYAAAIVVGALGATYAAVPLYKVFCQTTGFGGTTQRVRIGDQEMQEMGPLERLFQSAMGALTFAVPSGGSSGASTSSGRVHTWTDEEAAAKLASLKPVENADLITVRFDTTVDDIMPWTFRPVQLDVKVVPGETALSFFRVTNKSDKAITGSQPIMYIRPKWDFIFKRFNAFVLKNSACCPVKRWICQCSSLLIPKFWKIRK
ncbi:hypothetical protein ACA910_020628 [Epithemia clementina (nom. ined.)]